MVSRCSIVVSVDEDEYDNGEVDIEKEINHYLNQGNWAHYWELEDPDKGVAEVSDKPELTI